MVMFCQRFFTCVWGPTALAAPGTSASARHYTRPACKTGTDRPARRAVRKNFFLLHWRGDFSLARAYWINNFLLTLFWTQVTAAIVASGLTREFGIRASGFWSLGVLSIGVTLSIWSMVGVWRSAERHAARGGRAVWGRVAMVVLALALLRLVIVGIEQAPIVGQSVMLAIGRDTMPAARLRIVNRATEVEISGGLSFGTADRLKAILDATPSIRTVRLDSSGGWIAEGAKLADLVERRKLSTHTARECDSACLLVFMAGEHRSLGSNANLGFHEASIAGVGGKVASDGTQTIREALERKGVPEAFIRNALSTPASSIWYPTTQELIAAHVITAVVDEPFELAVNEARPAIARL
jgi:hypothetical protein